MAGFFAARAGRMTCMNTPSATPAALPWQNVLARFFIIVVLGGIGIFCVVCLEDIVIVTQKPYDLGTFFWWENWVLLSLPVIICLGGAAFLRGVSIWLRAPLSIT